MEIDISPILQTIVALGFAALSAAGSYALKALKSRYDIEAFAPELEKLVHEGLAEARKAAMGASKRSKVHIENDLVARATSYVARNGPRTLKTLGITQDAVREKVTAHLAEIEAWEAREEKQAKRGK